jgi:general secretion pathway protein D
LRNIINRAAGEEVQILGEVKLVADERTNAILVFANQQDLKMIKRIIGELDKVQSQVLIEAIIMEVSLTDSLNYGVSATQNPKAFGRDFTGAGAILNGQGFLNNLTNFPGSLGSGFSYLGTLGRDRFDVALSALAADNRVNILQRPRIQTSHAVSASIFIGETRPYPTGSSYGGLYGGFNTINQLAIGITLEVLPIINPDGLVVMEIYQTIDSVGGEVQIANVGSVPSTVNRVARATVAVRDGDTVVVGGFINNQKNKSKSGVPILKDIPLLGALFRSTSSSSQRTELVILIRPTVLPTPEVAAVTKLNEEERLPAVIRHAQEEMSIEERRRDEKFQREIEKLQRRP